MRYFDSRVELLETVLVNPLKVIGSEIHYTVFRKRVFLSSKCILLFSAGEIKDYGGNFRYADSTQRECKAS